jgi:hypothetical protein
MNRFTEALNRSMQAHALARWETQRSVPSSPGRVNTEGMYELCLGAALAEAATHALEGEKAARSFIDFLSRSGTKTAIVDQLVVLGWSADFAWTKIMINDRTPKRIRKTALRGELRSFEIPEAVALGVRLR